MIGNLVVDRGWIKGDQNDYWCLIRTWLTRESSNSCWEVSITGGEKWENTKFTTCLWRKLFKDMEKRVNRVCPRLWLLGRPACQAGSWLASEHLFGKQFHTITVNSPWLIRCYTVPKFFVWVMWFLMNTYFPSGSLEFA